MTRSTPRWTSTSASRTSHPRPRRRRRTTRRRRRRRPSRPSGGDRWLTPLIPPSRPPHTPLIFPAYPLIPPAYPPHTPLIPSAYPPRAPIIPPSYPPHTPLISPLSIEAAAAAAIQAKRWGPLQSRLKWRPCEPRAKMCEQRKLKYFSPRIFPTMDETTAVHELHPRVLSQTPSHAAASAFRHLWTQTPS